MAPKADPADRRPRGWLETDVKRILDEVVEGKRDVPEDQELTPHYLAKLVQAHEKAEAPPSTGAVSAVLLRWHDIGFAKLQRKPLRFNGYTKAAETKGLTELKAAHTAKKRKARKAQRDADAEAEAPAAEDESAA